MRIRFVFACALVATIAFAIGTFDGAARRDESGTPVRVATGVATEPVVLVEIEDFAFTPSRVEIAVGDTVRWKNLDTSPHSVLSDEDDEPVDSGRMDKGAGFRHRFDTPGTFNYECGYHQNMGGTITVRSVAGAPSPGASPAS